LLAKISRQQRKESKSTTMGWMSIFFAEALKRIAMNIDYDNFKNSVAAKQGSMRAHLYGDVWKALWTLKML